MLKRVIWPAVVLLALAIVPLRAEIVEQVLVKVNGDIITMTDFEKKQLAALQERPELAKLPPNSPELAKVIAQATPQLILSAVDDLLYLQRAREHGWALTPERFTEIIGNIRKANNLEDDATFQRELKAAGLTEEELKRNIERDVLINQVQRADVIEKINVTEEEVNAYYKEHSKEFTTPGEVMLREVLIPVPTTDKGVNVAQDDDARARAEDARKRLLAGEPFPRIASELSSAPSKANGGLIGPVRYDELSGSLQDLLRTMEIGDITEVLSSSRGYQILKLESRSETKVKSLEDARSAVAQAVAQQKSTGELMKYLEKLRSQAKISWRHQELKKAYDTALAERRRALGLPADGPPEA